MYPLIQHKTLVSCGREPARSLPLRRGFLLIPLILVCFAFSPQMQAVSPPPDGDYPNFTTAEGQNALKNLVGGAGNTAVGWFSQFGQVNGSFNTALGAGTLALNGADSNTALGTAALILNTTGTRNTAVGTAAMVFNQGEVTAGDGMGSFNGAVGAFALNQNTTGFSNNAFGDSALQDNVIGANNTAVGDLALVNNDFDGSGTANFNTAVGAEALFSNTTGDSNGAVGFNALGGNVDGLFNNAMGFDAMADNLSGAGNVAIGDSVGLGNTTGDFNTYVGVNSVAIVDGESDTIRIGDPTFGVACFIGGISNATVVGAPVLVDANGQLGVAVAGSPLSMNEIMKERQLVQELKNTTEKQAARIALQEGQIDALTASLRQQAEQIQKVSAQLEMVRPTPRVVENR
jgi:hypothetical protein